MDNILNLGDFIRDAKPTCLGEEVQREIEVERLLETYRVDYVVKNFPYVLDEYGFTRKRLEAMAPECVERRRAELAQEAAVGELMNRVVGVE